MLSRERYVVGAVVGLAIVLSMAMARGFEWLWVWQEWNDPFMLGIRQLPLTSVIAYAISAALAFATLRHPDANTMALEVVDELSKVVWPTREETGHATMIVVIAVLISSAFLGAFDAVWLWMTDWILGIEKLPGG
jgi:preprotein translocase SecE subunit